MLKTRMGRSTLLALVCSGTFTAHAIADAPKRIDVPAGELVRALDMVSRQAAVDLVFQPDQLKSFRTDGVSGTYSPQEAIRILLKGTPFELRTDASSGAMVIAPPRTGSNIEGEPSEAVEEIIVTGSHIRGSEPTGSKLMVIGREQIDQSGYGRLQDVLDTLPQNFSGVSEDFSQAGTSNLTYGAEIQLRGLGPGTTLTLLNGHRLPGGGSLGAFTDISSIPVSAIERAEILADGASAIYGSDAIGGVVNIILRDDFEGAETRTRFASADGDANEMELAQLFGETWSSGNLLVGYQYTQRDAFEYDDSPYLESGDLRPFGGADRRRDSPLRRGGAPGNILNAAGEVAYAIPANQDGTNLTAAQLLPGAINYQDVSYVTMLPEQKMHSVFASLSQRMGDRVEFSLDALYSLRRTELLAALNGVVVSVPSRNPFYVNPFGGTGPVRVEYDFTNELGLATSNSGADALWLSLGPTVDLGGDWALSVSGSYGRELGDWRRSNRVNSSAIAAAVNNPDRAVALNVFGNGVANNPDTLASIRLPDEFDRATNETWAAEAIADGPLFMLPAGAVRLAFGSSYRETSLDLVSNNTVASRTSNSRTNFAGFAELSVPIVSPDQGLSWSHRLDLSLSVRYDRYNDFGSTFNPRAGLGWAPHKNVILRGTWGTSFRAPPFYLANMDVNRPQIRSGNIADPTSPTRQTAVAAILGVVPDLKEETAEVWTAGIEFPTANGFSTSLTYFEVAYKDRIAAPFIYTAALVNESQFAGSGLIIRNPTQAQVDFVCANPAFDGTCGSGPFLAVIDSRRRNLSRSNVSGIDAHINYEFDTALGRIGTGVNGTYSLAFENAVTDLAPTIDILDTYQNPVALRINGMLSWSRGSWSANTVVRYTDSYKNNAVMPVEIIGSWTTVDVGIGYRIGGAPVELLAGLEVRLAATNVFDKLPPFVDVLVPYDTANASIVGRTVSLQGIKKW